MMNEQRQKLPLNRHCERSEAIQNIWIATPLGAARNDEMDDSQRFNKKSFFDDRL